MEDALVLARIASHVTLIHRGSRFRASHVLAERVRSHSGIRIMYRSRVIRFEGDAHGELAGVVVATEAEGEGEGGSTTREPEIDTLAVTAAFIAVGHDPNSQIFRGALATDAHGYLRTGSTAGATHTSTSVEGIFAAGDVSDSVYRQAITSAGTGAMAALDAERWLSAQGIKPA